MKTSKPSPCLSKKTRNRTVNLMVCNLNSKKNVYHLNKWEISADQQLCNCSLGLGQLSLISMEAFLKIEEDVILSTVSIEKKEFLETGPTAFEIRFAVLLRGKRAFTQHRRDSTLKPVITIWV